ncbi:PIN domain-containing protein [Nocardia tengchongensis]|uniref:PIN domain-containing protein n=1 Tax=Nocardia tengchongensis TaxID=2055889 RepID=UPI0036AF8F35
MTLVVVDTNVLCSSPKLRRPEWLALVENRENWGGMQIVVPEVVFMETVNVVRRMWSEQSSLTAKLKVWDFGLKDQQDAMITEINRHSDEYEQWLRDHLDQIGVTIMPTPQVDLLEIARRASQQRAPYRKDNDGFRDTLIWFAVMAIAEENAGEQVWLLSENHKDFGPERTGRGPSPQDDCPFPLHPDLVADLDGRGLSGRVEYVADLARLVRHFESQFEPIPEDELAQLTSRIDLSVLAERFIDALVEFRVDPQRAALPLQVVVAQVLGAQKPDDGWEFSDGAGRGEAGWTARFCVTTEVDVELIGEGLTSREDTKPLQVSGDVMVSADGQIQDVLVTSVDALPDDPMRARWERRAERVAGIANSWTPQLNSVYSAGLSELAAKLVDDQAVAAKLAGQRWSNPFANMPVDNFAEMARQALSTPSVQAATAASLQTSAIADMVARMPENNFAETARQALSASPAQAAAAASLQTSAIADMVARMPMNNFAEMARQALSTPSVQAATASLQFNVIADMAAKFAKDRETAIAKLVNDAVVLGVRPRGRASEFVDDEPEENKEPDGSDAAESGD